MSYVYIGSTIGFLLVSFAMVLIILVQRPQGGGLATAFGGAGGGNDTAFGGRTGDALTVATVATFFLYLLFAIGVNVSDSPRARSATTPGETPGQTSGDAGVQTGAPSNGAAVTPPISVTPLAPGAAPISPAPVQIVPAVPPTSGPANTPATPNNPVRVPPELLPTPAPTTPPAQPAQPPAQP